MNRNGEKLKQIRNERQMSLKDVANELNITDSRLMRIEDEETTFWVTKNGKMPLGWVLCSYEELKD